ncbi:MAG: (Fe-S)-binding protein [Rhodospirillaceae bacterium]|nr:MAG: (Fe-S)-binding protein [Rhodospirillaceae bacterium]
MSLEERKRYIAKCPRCSQCKWVPAPKSQRFAAICPSIEYGKFHSYSAGGKGVTAYALAEGKAGYSETMVKSVYACTMCGACDTACKTNFGDNVEPLDTLYALRSHIAEAGHGPSQHAAIIDNLRREGNRWGKPRRDRGAWADGFGLKDITATPAEVFLHIGCASAYDPERWGETRFATGLLQRAGVDFGIAGNAETDCGSLAHDLGFRREALDFAKANAELILASKASVVVTLCAEAYAAFRNVYPRLGVSLGDVRILHISEYVETLLAEGRIDLKLAGDLVATYHDPCKLGRLSEVYEPWQGRWTQVLNVVTVADPPRKVLFGTQGNYDAPRQLMGRVVGLSLVEMERTREISYCCGAGGGAAETYPDFAEATARDRLSEAEATGANVLITACSGCEVHLRRTAEATGSVMKVRSLLGLLAEAAGMSRC